MLENKIESTSKADLSKREKFFQEFPEEREYYKDWPFWDSNGYPTPNPAEVKAIIAKGLVVEDIRAGKKIESLSNFNIFSIPEHPAGRAYMDECNAIADSMSKEEVLAALNEVRASYGKPPLTMKQYYGSKE